MKITAFKIKNGMATASGEIVKSVKIIKPKVWVMLFNPKNNKTRSAIWAYYGTIFMKDINEDQAAT